MEKVKLIIKFPFLEISEKEKDEISNKIKLFHKESLVLFGDDIEITVLKSNE
jgi:hypothetical protein